MTAPNGGKSDYCSAYCITVPSDEAVEVAVAAKDHNPYCYTCEGYMHRMAQRLLEHEPSVLSLFAETPFASAPAQVRARAPAVGGLPVV